MTEACVGRKILFFIQSREIGGVETQLKNLIKYWPDKEDHFSIWCNRSYKGKDFFKDLGILCETVVFPTISECHARIDAWFLPGILKKCVKAAVSLTRPFFLLTASFFFARRLSLYRPDIFFSDNGGYPAAELCLAAVVGARLAGIRQRFLMIHSCPLPRRFPFRWIDRAIDHLVARSATQMVTISQACARELLRLRFEGVSLKVIYNGIESCRSGVLPIKEKRNVLRASDDDKIIGLIGDYEPLKGHEFLIRAAVDIFCHDPRAKMVFIGSDAFSHAAYLKQLARDLGVSSRIVFTGYLKNACEYAECFDVLVLPSVAHEGFGLALLEGMMFAKPVVGTDMGGIPEVIGDAGFIVPPGDPQALVDIISRLLADPVLRAEFGAKGYKRLNEKFTPLRMANEYFELTRR